MYTENVRTIKRVALVVDHIETEYSRRIFEAASRHAWGAGMELLLFPISQIRTTEYPFDYQYLAVASLLSPANVDGIVFVVGSQMEYAGRDYLRSYIRSFHPVPVVSIGCAFADVPSVLASGAAGFTEVVEHLILAHHCRRLALMGVSSNSTDMQERMRTFTAVLERHAIPVDSSLLLDGGFSYEQAWNVLERYRMARGKIDFDAVVALNDQMAFACIDYLQGQGLRVPQDVAVTGYDDDVHSSFITPALTTVNQDLDGQAAAALDILAAVFAGKPHESMRTLPSRAIFRQSCGCTGEGAAGHPSPVAAARAYAGAGEWCSKRDQFVRVIHLYTGMQTDMTLNQFRSHINSDLSSMGISAAAVILFEAPMFNDEFEYFSLPARALVYSAFDQRTGYSLGRGEHPLFFNPQVSMVPENIFADMQGMHVVSLFRAQILYGYIIFRPGSYDATVYSMVCKMFSSTLSSAYSMTRSQQEKRELEKEYDVANMISVTDEMTGLLNRRGFITLGQKSLEIALASRKAGMVLYGDIDGLKKINDTYGHAAGDRAIKAESRLLRSAFRTTDIIGRLGGDEFGIMAPSLTEEKLEYIRRHLAEACAKWSRDSGEQFTLSISLGFTVFDADRGVDDIKFLLEEADSSLYVEKRKKHGGH